MKRPGPHRRQGQTLVMFALTLLLLVVMVCMTLSFGTKAKEKMELQQVADQSAYSTAVAVARGMNVLAFTNRIAIAHYVAMLGLNSSSSFATLSLGILWGQTLYYMVDLPMQTSACGNPFTAWCGCPGMFGVGMRLLRAGLEILRIQGVMAGLDAQVARSANGASLATLYLYAGQLETMFVQMFNRAIDSQRMARRVVGASTPGGEWQAPGGASAVAEREVGKIPYVDGALNFTNAIASDRHAVWAAMASRGHPWTAGRANWLPLSGAGMLLMTWATRVLGGDPLPLISDGSGYFGANFHTNVLWSSSSRAAVADDHATWFPIYKGLQCPGPTLPLMVAVSYTYSENGLNQHRAGIGIFIPAPAPPDVSNQYVLVLFPLWMEAIHTLSNVCAFNCPSAWTNFVDYNLFKVAFGGDNFAQPKIPVVVQRDMRRRPSADPWNLFFKFRFSQGATVDLDDNNGIILNDGTDISLQTALSTGIAYYHRQGHWKEPPNLLSPFWRAGLTRADIDDQARSQGGDIAKVLQDANAGWAADAYSNLYAAGFRGIQ